MRKIKIVISIVLIMVFAVGFVACTPANPDNNGAGGDDTDNSNPGTDDGETGSGNGEDLTPYYTRVDDDTILFGSYPQSEVTDESILSRLNTLAGELPSKENPKQWTSYGYLQDITYIKSDYMWFIDLAVDGEMYRGVYFVEYRPRDINKNGGGNLQENYGFELNSVYWYKYEPISWTILEEKDGKAMLLCDIILDCQQFNFSYTGSVAFDFENMNFKDYIVNNYAESTVKSWLNETFYLTAFTTRQQSKIDTVLVDNSLESTCYETNENICENTEDKIFLLSVREIAKYFFDGDHLTFMKSDALMRKVTKYAYSQGVYACTWMESYMDYGTWMLRTPDNEINYGVITVEFDNVGDEGWYRGYSAGMISNGIVPALWISL